MPEITKLSWRQIKDLIALLPPGRMWGVPRGGAIVAALSGRQTENLEDADYIVDDIVDSGRTRAMYAKTHPHKPFYGLIDKTADPRYGWFHFPWEHEPMRDAEDNVVRLLEFIGEDPNREGLLKTPHRVLKSLQEQCSGYQQDPATILATNFDGEKYDEMVLLRNIEFYSMCEHHMLPFTGLAHVAYVPGVDKPRIVGLSKLARLVDCFARRLQVQERLTAQIADSLQEHLNPRGVGVVIEAKHFCMSCRGVQKHQSSMITSALRGVFQSGPARAEFLSLVNLNSK